MGDGSPSIWKELRIGDFGLGLHYSFGNRRSAIRNRRIGRFNTTVLRQTTEGTKVTKEKNRNARQKQPSVYPAADALMTDFLAFLESFVPFVVHKHSAVVLGGAAHGVFGPCIERIVRPQHRRATSIERIEYVIGGPA